jgi:hypothetical protein
MKIKNVTIKNMKHIFLIHSHTLYLTAIGTIEYLNLKQDEVIFIYSRNYKTVINDPYLSIDMSEATENCFHSILSFSRRNYFINYKLKHNIINTVDTLIDTYVIGKFMLYICHLQSFMCQIFATNNKCIVCNFIQEGGRVMSKYLTNKNWLLFRLYNALFLKNEQRIWKSISWFPPENSLFQKPIKTYAIDANFFGKQKYECHLIQWPRLEISYKIEVEYPIFIYEGAVELGLIEQNIYMNAVEKQIDKFSEKENYVRFHPMQTSKAKNSIKYFFIKRNKIIIEIPPEVPFEMLLLSYSNLKICGFGTSLLFFAKKKNHNVISDEINLLISRKYRRYYNGISHIDEVIR